MTPSIGFDNVADEYSGSIDWLAPNEYLDLHYPDAPENCEAVGESHRWHNLDDKRSTCYHCKAIQDSQFWK